MGRLSILPVLLMLSSCSGKPTVNGIESSNSRGIRGSDRVVLLARIDQKGVSGAIHAYSPSVDYRSGLVLKVVQVIEGRFLHATLGIAAHSGSMLRFFMLLGESEDSRVELTLAWDPEANLYRLEEWRLPER